MKIFILGITGKVGFRLARILKERGDEVDGLYRQTDQAQMLASIGITGTFGDLMSIDPQRLAQAMQGSDAIVFSAGAGGAGSDITEAIDGNGITKTIEAAKLASIKRFLLVSVFPEAWRERHMHEGFEHYIKVKKRADIELTQSGLDWLILRPSALKETPGAGTINLGVAQLHTEVSRDDVAATLAALLHTPMVSRKILELTAGNTPIAEAIDALTTI
ncbi:SDR family oxidoreductase [Halomonas salipaludis]|uniref:NAD-dependent dehydratase n=1 Tax=Halomonas salipaludis TaxID=2032625 RepID=A0A2A2ER67_9GAMM|nr:SDR family oxidoreductase [Halomonas salipaludis]PAU75040.1 NAD-dependent dehydratase [Halomonas salipaludis]